MCILIADDSVLLREGIGLILGDGGHEAIASVGGEALIEIQAVISCAS